MMATEEPIISWPSSFETVFSNNDPALNITEVLYFVRDVYPKVVCRMEVKIK